MADVADGRSVKASEARQEPQTAGGEGGVGEGGGGGGRVSDRDVGLNAGPSPPDFGYTTRLRRSRCASAAPRCAQRRSITTTVTC